MNLKKRKQRPPGEISIRWWDELVRRYFRERIRDITPGDPRPWRHPWSCDLSWDALEEVWRLAIEPGYCLSPTGTVEVTVPLAAESAPAETLDRLGLTTKSDQVVDVPLSEGPSIVLTASRWRPVGTESVGVGDAAGEAAPAYFRALGVASPTRMVETGGGLKQEIEGNVTARRQARLLRALDVVIRHDRRRVIYAASLDGAAQTVSYAPTLLPPPSESGATIEIQTRYLPASEQGLLGELVGSALDRGYDETRIATLYLMSPPGMPPGSPLDGTWSPAVRHGRFWNLEYVTKYREPEPTAPPITFPVTGLGMGTLEQNVRPILDELNANAALTETILSQARAAGRFVSLA